MAMLAAVAVAVSLAAGTPIPGGAPVHRIAQQESPQAPAANKAPAAKPAAAKPAAKPAAKSQPAKPAAAKPAPKTTEKRIGEVTVVDAPEQPYFRLDGPWREKGYELRTWLTSYVYRDKDIRPPYHTLTVQVTHHDDRARNYGKALGEKDAALDIAVATRPNQQCIRNRDGTRLCFYTEAYTVTVPDEVLAAARAKGLSLSLDGGGAKAPLAVAVDAATVAAQLKAEEEVAKR